MNIMILSILSDMISHPHSWIKIIYKFTHDITSIFYIYIDVTKCIQFKYKKNQNQNCNLMLFYQQPKGL